MAGVSIYPPGSGPKRQTGPALFRRNLKLFSVHWPPGVYETCIDLMDQYPGWRVSWLYEYWPTDKPATFWAWHPGEQRPHEVELRDADPVRLAERIAESTPPPHDYSLRGCLWCLAWTDRRAVRQLAAVERERLAAELARRSRFG